MVLRALATSSVTCAALGLAPTVPWLIGIRTVTGLGSGVGAAATAIVAEGTPSRRLAGALGLTAGAVAIGQVAGPILGGLLATVWPLRWLFVAGGIAVAVSVPAVAHLVREPPAPAPGAAPGVRAALASAPPETVRILVGLGFGLGLVFFCAVGGQQLFVLELIALHLPSVALATGVTFSAFGLATVATSSLCGRIVARFGHSRTAMVAAALLVAGLLGCTFRPQQASVIASAALAGAGFGLLVPIVNTQIGLLAPGPAKATVFGFAFGMQGLGYGLGPLATGLCAALGGIAVGFLVAAAATAGAGLLVYRGTAQEPRAGPSGTVPNPVH